MKGIVKIMVALAAALSTFACAVLPAQAAFGFNEVGVKTLTKEGALAIQAGSHPYAFETNLSVNTEINPVSGRVVPSQELKDLSLSFPPGLVGNPYAVPRCPVPLFLAGELGECSDASAVGVALIKFGNESVGEPLLENHVAVYNLEPGLGSVARIGFIVGQRAPVTIEVGVDAEPPNRVTAHATNISQALFFRS